MRRKLVLLNLALVALIALAGWRLRVNWAATEERESALWRGAVKALPARPAAPLVKVAPVAGAAYAEIAQKMLFARDRNPNVLIDAVPAKPMPPLPVAHGVMRLGGTTLALLSERAGVAERAYQADDMVGPFKLLSVSRDELVLEWEGKQITKKVAELMEAGSRPGAPGAASPAEAAAGAPATVNTMRTSAPAQPGASLGGETRACQPGDNSPSGTVNDGMKKVVNETPFGRMCRWEPVK